MAILLGGMPGGLLQGTLKSLIWGLFGEPILGFIRGA